MSAAEADLQMESCNDAICRAAENGDLDGVRAAIDAGAEIDAKDSFNRTPLFLAAWNCHTQIIRELLEAKANVNSTDSEKWCPLYGAAFRRKSESLRILIKEGNAEVDLRDRDWTSLHCAAFYGHFNCVKVLIETPSLSKLIDRCRLADFIYNTRRQLPQAVAQLLAAFVLFVGADPTIRTKRGRRAVDLARDWEYEDVDEYLQQFTFEE